MSSASARSAIGRTGIVGLVAAALAAFLLALAPNAQAAKGMEITLQDEGVFLRNTTPFDRVKAYDLARGIQVSRIRFNAVWTGLNNERCEKRKPSTPTYNFAGLDAAIDQARAQGFKILLGITGPAPAWANGKKTCGRSNPYKPSSREFGKFAKLVTERYKGRVDQYSIWNEPNHKGWLQPVKSNGTLYRALYAAGYQAIKRVDKKAKVFIGELAPYASKPSVALQPLAFLRQLTCTDRSYRPLRGKRCAALKADGFAHHPYDFARAPNRRYPNRDAVTIANLSSLTSALDRLRRAKRLVPTKGSRMYLYLTEYGYFASRVSSRNPLFPESRRATYLVDAYKIAQRNSRVKQMLQFLLVQYPNAGTTRAGFNFDTSIVKLNGTKTRPYSALASWTKTAAKKKQVKAAPKAPTSSTTP